MALKPTIQLRDVPPAETIRSLARRYSSVDPSAVEAYLSVVVTGNQVVRAIETYLARHQMAPGRFGVLMYLLREERQRALPSELADWLGVTRATMTGLLDGLERDQLVRRDEHPDDRRMTLVALTAQGEACLDCILPDYFRMTSGLVSRLSSDDRKQLVRLLGKVRDGVRTGVGG